jgi:hypothetical protein
VLTLAQCTWVCRQLINSASVYFNVVDSKSTDKIPPSQSQSKYCSSTSLRYLSGVCPVMPFHYYSLRTVATLAPGVVTHPVGPRIRPLAKICTECYIRMAALESTLADLLQVLPTVVCHWAWSRKPKMRPQANTHSPLILIIEIISYQAIVIISMSDYSSLINTVSYINYSTESINSCHKIRLL